MNNHEYQNGRTTHGVTTLLMDLPCSSEVRGNGLLRLYCGGDGKHRVPEQTGIPDE
jgi:hypothetical protein